MEELNAAMEAGTSDAVKIWMNWMGIVFIASLIFVWKHKTARYAFLALVLTMPLGFGVWKFTGNIHLMGITHLLVWTPLVFIIYLREFCATGTWPDTPFVQRFKSPYFIWICLLFVTICISLIFDIRDLVLVIMGQK
ncbi:MAG: hypothetical protein HKN88_02980 [Gammaproteobacteria bacterium]|nr:hypothetical protein [Gammaproteobacteria bacterium]